MKRRVKRNIDLKNCYILFVSVVAVLSLMGNIFQDIYYNQALDIQQQTLETFAAEYYETYDAHTASISYE